MQLRESKTRRDNILALKFALEHLKAHWKIEWKAVKLTQGSWLQRFNFLSIFLLRIYCCRGMQKQEVEEYIFNTKKDNNFSFGNQSLIQSQVIKKSTNYPEIGKNLKTKEIVLVWRSKKLKRLFNSFHIS